MGSYIVIFTFTVTITAFVGVLVGYNIAMHDLSNK